MKQVKSTAISVARLAAHDDDESDEKSDRPECEGSFGELPLLTAAECEQPKGDTEADDA